MRRILVIMVGFALTTAFDTVSALDEGDINPSKNNQPPGFWDTTGNHFSIFNGDPKRIQRANEVDPKAFDTKLDVSPNPLSLKVAKQIGPNPSVKITFSIHNHGKKTYTLSFPTAQRWDFRIVSASGAVAYTYSDDHEFVQTVGVSMVNQDDKLVYTENVDFDDMTSPLAPGIYTVQAVMANYPEMTARTQLTVQE
ncbi:MAG: BsuPI-related putative proteinase inhibitor [Methylacidiphilales bacterium]|nr:BsuPI-related putative proteinase inhibitor [Candidatus Methylacidiphilales bacterium]